MARADFDVAQGAKKTATKVARHYRLLLRMIKTIRLTGLERRLSPAPELRAVQCRKGNNPQERIARRAREEFRGIEEIRRNISPAFEAGDLPLAHAAGRITRVLQIRSWSVRFSSSNAAMM